MSGVPLRADQICVGRPIEHDVFDARGKLLLKRGFIIQSVGQRDRLIDEGLYVEPKPDAAHAPAAWSALHHAGRGVPVLERIRGIRAALEPLLEQAPPELPQAIAPVAAEIARMVELDPDAALASVLVERDGNYSPRHALNCAIVVDRLLQGGEVPPPVRPTLLAATLTMNISMTALQNELDAQASPLSAAQQEAVRTHAARSAAKLRQRGVADPAWLAAVEHHHDDAVGGTGVGTPAEMIALADRYCAAVTGRQYRAGLVPATVLREIFMQGGRGVNPMLAKLLVREMGIYPPGSVVELANRDMAVVVKRMPHANQPVVRSVVNGMNARLDPPLKRLTSDPMFAVKAAVGADRLKQPIDPKVFWADAFELAPDPAQAASTTLAITG